jgi:hypothetical protein
MGETIIDLPGTKYRVARVQYPSVMPHGIDPKSPFRMGGGTIGKNRV